MLYFILILTISLKSYDEQQKKKLSASLTFNSKVSSISHQEHSNDLEQALLTVSSIIINKKEQTIPKLKLLIYYNTKMLNLILNSHSKSIDNYISIDSYIESIINVLRSSESLNTEEKNLFLEEILLGLGLIFKSLISEKKPSNIINTQEQELLLEYYIKTCLDYSDYVNKNFTDIKNILCKINESNCIPLLYENETEENNIVKTQETVLKKDPKYIALSQLNNSLFYFLVFFIKDTIIGSKLFNDIQSNIDNNSVFKLIIIYILQKELKVPLQKRLLIISIVEFLSEQNFQNYDDVNFYLNLFFLYFKDELLKDSIIKEKCTNLLVNLFINHINYNDVILDSVFTFPNKSNIMIMDSIFIVDFIYLVSNKLTDINSFENQQQILVSFIDLLIGKANNQNSEITTNNSRNTNSLIVRNNLNLQTQIFITIIQNFSDISDSEVSDKSSFTINYSKFLILLYNHCTQNYEFLPEHDKNLCEQIFLSIINLIHNLILLNGKNDVNNYNKYSKEIINLIRMLINFIIQDTNLLVSDSFIIYNVLGSLYKKISKQEDLVTTVPFASHIYKITFGIIILLINIYKLTVSPTIINNEISSKLSNLNLECSVTFNEDDLNDLLKQIENLNSFLSFLEQKIEFNEIITSHNNGFISLDLFNQIIKIIYSTIFENSSMLNLFYESQENINSKHDEQKSVVVTEVGEKLLDINELNLNFTITNQNEHKQKSYFDALNDFPSFDKGIKDDKGEKNGNHEENIKDDIRFEHNNILPRIDNINNSFDTDKSTNIKL